MIRMKKIKLNFLPWLSRVYRDKAYRERVCLKYQGYACHASYCRMSKAFLGTVIGLGDGMARVQAATLWELEQAFCDFVDAFQH